MPDVDVEALLQRAASAVKASRTAIAASRALIQQTMEVINHSVVLLGKPAPAQTSAPGSRRSRRA